MTAADPTTDDRLVSAPFLTVIAAALFSALAFSSTLPIPPVVYTGPQMAVGESMLFVRGSGIQGKAQFQELGRRLGRA